jgi:hypothetical protein
MNERGHYGNGTLQRAYVGEEASKSKDSSLSRLIVPGAIAGVILLGVVLDRKLRR